MMMSQEITYRPQPATEGVPKNLNVTSVAVYFHFDSFAILTVLLCSLPSMFAQMVATVTVGVVKDAKAHIDVQGFNVYHKNRLIKVVICLIVSGTKETVYCVYCLSLIGVFIQIFVS